MGKLKNKFQTQWQKICFVLFKLNTNNKNVDFRKNIVE